MGRLVKDPAQVALDFDLDSPVGGESVGVDVGRSVRAIARPVAVPPSVRRPTRRAGARRKDFVVGRLSRKTREMRILDEAASPIRGPWSLHALVRDAGPRLRLV